jgi:hypothetical protein
VALASIKTLFAPMLCKLNEKEQKKEWHHISTLGNIEELNRIASETAGLVTLYYREQIESIDSLQKIKGSSALSDKKNWLQQVYDVRPESSEEKAIVLVADYVTAWIIDGLKPGKDQILSTESVSQQLWLHVAQSDPIDERSLTKLSDIPGVISAGQQKISLKNKNASSSGNNVQVQLRYLIGCVSLIGDDGTIYQCKPPSDSSNSLPQDLEVFGYVYATPFSSDETVLQRILNGRKLVPAKQDKNGVIRTRFNDTEVYVSSVVSLRLHKKQLSKSLKYFASRRLLWIQAVLEKNWER